MPKPQSKEALLEVSQKNYKALIDLVNSFSSEDVEKEFPEGTLNRNIRDVLAHLHHWHLMMLGWYVVGMKGEKPTMPAEGYTWKTLPELNQNIRQEYQNTDLETVMRLLHESYQSLQKVIAKHSNKELFEKKKYK